MNRPIRLLLLALSGLAIGAATPVAAADALHARAAGVDGPFFPPRPPSAVAPPATTGSALQEQAFAHLRDSFKAADTAGAGTLTREQARRGGLAFVADHFEQIDTGRRGSVSFEDIRHYLQDRAR